VGFLTSHNPYRPPPPATVIALLFTFTSKTQTRNVTKKCRPNSFINIIIIIIAMKDRLFGLVVRVPGYRSRGPGSIPGTTRLSVK
jgi:hypothetical protein